MASSKPQSSSNSGNASLLHRFRSLIDLSASASAGLLARLVCHPVDTMKSRYQAKAFENYQSSWGVLRDTWRHEGVRGLYRGFGVASIGAVPGVCSYLTTYQKSKDYMAANTKLSPFITHLIGGILAEAVCCVWFVPVDVIKERMQVQTTEIYRSSFDAIRKIMGTEGLGGLYKGYIASVASFGPFSALYFMFYEEAKNRIRQYRNGNGGDSNRSSSSISSTSTPQDLSFIESLLASSAAGSLAAFLTSPLDLVKLRLQVQAMPIAPSPYSTLSCSDISSKVTSPIASDQVVVKRNLSGFIHLMRDIYSKQGIRGLFRGSLARIMFHAPNTAITLTAYEQIKKRVTFAEGATNY